MSIMLSREVSRWIQSNPGPIYGLDDTEVWEKVLAEFRRARRWKAEIKMQDFMLYVANCGYRTEVRPRHGEADPNASFVMLALPEPPRGF